MFQILHEQVHVDLDVLCTRNISFDSLIQEGSSLNINGSLDGFFMELLMDNLNVKLSGKLILYF